MNNNTVKDNKSFFLAGMILSMFCWGLSWTSGKILSSYGAASELTLFRFGLTFISLLMMLVFIRQELKIKKEGWVDLLSASLFISLYTWLFFKGLYYGKAGAGGVLVTTLNPIIAYGIMLLGQKRLPVKKETLGLSIGFIAAILLLKLWTNWESILSSGNLYFLFATLSWAILSLFTARSSRYGSPVSFSLWMYGLCSLIMCFLSDSSEIQNIIKQSDTYFWGNLIFASIITTAFATTFYFVATSKIGAGRASSFIFLVPFSAALGGWIFLQEIPEWHTITGGTLGVLAVYVLNKEAKNR